MKLQFFFIPLLLVSFLVFINFSNKQIVLKKYIATYNYVDSFMYHYNILDSINKKSPYNTPTFCIQSVKYMENLTSIKAHSDGNYIGWFDFTREDLNSWFNWFKLNHNKLTSPALRNILP